MNCETNCKTCRYWNRQKPNAQGMCVCGSIHEDSGICGDAYLALNELEKGHLVSPEKWGEGGLDLWTPADFGCANWEQYHEFKENV